MLPMSDPNGSTNLAEGDECDMANPPSNSPATGIASAGTGGHGEKMIFF
jgi:hypothetical protein